MYAHNVHRDDYQDLARDMLGLPGIVQETKQGRSSTPASTWSSAPASASRSPASRRSRRQGKNGVAGNLYITDADKAAIDVKNGGKYVVVADRARGQRRPRPSRKAADGAAERGQRLFGFFGSKTLNHLPYRTADGRLRPRPRHRRQGRDVHRRPTSTRTRPWST